MRIGSVASAFVAVSKTTAIINHPQRNRKFKRKMRQFYIIAPANYLIAACLTVKQHFLL